MLPDAPFRPLKHIANREKTRGWIMPGDLGCGAGGVSYLGDHVVPGIDPFLSSGRPQAPLLRLLPPVPGGIVPACRLLRIPPL